MIRTYDIHCTYDENYQEGPGQTLPEFVNLPQSPRKILGLGVQFPFGISAGPLLNSRWIEAYARLGYSILTYKTVRSLKRACYAMPNMVPIAGRPNLCGPNATDEPGCPIDQSTWAVSFGMPSASPDAWRDDVCRAKECLHEGQILIVSVVGTPRDGWGPEELFDDYAQCAQWAKEAGADVIEANLSCPNVTTTEGQIYRNPSDSALVCGKIRERIGDRPLVVKIGAFSSDEEARMWLEAVAEYIDGVVTLNTLSRTIRRGDREAFPGRPIAGVTGAAIAQTARRCVHQMATLRRQLGLNLAILGVGGVLNEEGFVKMQEAGADAVLVASGAMLIPELSIRIRKRSARW